MARPSAVRLLSSVVMSLLVLLSGGAAPAQAPRADFSAAPAEGLAPLTVQFSDLSTGAPDSWAWDFQNDGTVDSTERNPQYTYGAMGWFSVKLTASNAGGSSETLKEDLISVAAPDLWTRRAPLDPPSGIQRPYMTYDAAWDHLVLFYGDNSDSADNSAWIGDGASWMELAKPEIPEHRIFPSPTGSFGIAYDNARDRAVLFYGYDCTTWEWNGAFWALRPSVSAPSGRRWFSMTYDAASRRVILFGGRARSGYATFNDTWAWDGTNWTMLTPSAKPPVRSNAAMAYDSARRRTVLFGGVRPGSMMSFIYLNDTWEWNGADWAQCNPAASPQARVDHALAYDAARQRVILFGGISPWPSNPLNDTWEWDGANWVERTPAASPPARSLHAMAYDSSNHCAVLLGGSPDSSQGTELHDSWEWNGANWTQRPQAPQPANPPVRTSDFAMAYDATRQRIVLFGGYTGASGGFTLLNDLWEWDGAAWSQAQPSTSPSVRIGHAMAYDKARGRLVLFGGMFRTDPFAPYTLLGDTWEWDGAAWTQVLPATSPSARGNHVMAYDSDRQRVVLFGGVTLSKLLSTETWEWDGVNWTKANPVHSPPYGRQMAYDAARRQTLLVAEDGTWLWDGTDWTKANPVHALPSLSDPDMIYDSARERIVATGNGWALGDIDGVAEVWEWDGTDWRPRVSLANPSRASRIAYDEARGCVVMLANPIQLDSGGHTVQLPNETWEYCAKPAARFTAAPMIGRAPLDVQFTDCSALEPDSWAWDFDNDGTVDSTERNPGHLYGDPGRYTVALTVENAAGVGSRTRSDYIVVAPEPSRSRAWTLFE